jgi:hypothetical protein
MTDITGNRTPDHIDCKSQLYSVTLIARTLITIGKEHRKLGMELKDVEFKLIIGDSDFSKEIELPTGWVEQRES